MNRFKTQVAIVMGASGGIGLATAIRFGRQGASVAMVARDAGRLAKALKKVEDAGAPDAMMLPGDVADEQTAEALVQTSCGRFGGLDILISNAGALTTQPLEKLSAKDWCQPFDVDLMGAFYFGRKRCGDDILRFGSFS